MKKKQIFIIVKILVSAALLVYIYYQIGPVWKDSAATIHEALSTRFGYFFLGIITFLAISVACSVRMKLLLDAQNVGFSLLTVLKLYFLGLFFSQFVPGGIASGDVIRAYYITRQSTDKKEEAVAINFLDRFIGILGMATILMIAIFFISSPLYRRVCTVIIACCFGAAIVAGLFFSKRVMKRFPFMKKLSARLPYRETLSRLYNTYNHFKHHKWRLAVGLLLSGVVHFSLVMIAYFFGKSLGMNVAFREHLIFMPLVAGIRAIPLSPVGDVGTAEAAFIEMYKTTGANSQEMLVAFAFMLRAVYLMWAIVGWVVYIRERAKTPQISLRKVFKSEKIETATDEK